MLEKIIEIYNKNDGNWEKNLNNKDIQNIKKEFRKEDADIKKYEYDKNTSKTYNQ